MFRTSAPNALFGRYLEADLLRSLQWLDRHGAEEGGTIILDLPEMGARGEALVTTILPCPKLDERPGCLVTGVFRHPPTLVLDLQLASESKPLGVTPNHLIWSVDRQAWMSVMELRIGERLSTINGTTTVDSITPHVGLEPVYNIEVEGDHVYRVGESGVLVHNTSLPCYITTMATYQSQSGEMKSVIRAVWDVRRTRLVTEDGVERAKGNIAGGKVTGQQQIVVERSGQPISARPLSDAEQAVIRYVQSNYDTDDCKAVITQLFTERIPCPSCATAIDNRGTQQGEMIQVCSFGIAYPSTTADRIAAQEAVARRWRQLGFQQ